MLHFPEFCVGIVVVPDNIETNHWYVHELEQDESKHVRWVLLGRELKVTVPRILCRDCSYS